MMSSQCHLAQGIRSIRDGMFVSMVRSSTGPATATPPLVQIPDVCRLRGAPGGRRWVGALVFLFFSNRLGCFGSLLVSAIFTVILLTILGVL